MTMIRVTILALLPLATVLALPVQVTKAEQPVVDLACGPVRGSVAPTDSLGDVYEFYQIPYGLPPVGSRRWTHSQLLEPTNGPCWDETFNATALPSPPVKCVQYYKSWEDPPLTGQEDCLVLSVRTPSLDPAKRLPVLVWIHGGSLMTGWSDEPGYAPDAEFTADMGVVTVTINYRLDLMGFFSSPEIWNDPARKGNYGNFGIGDGVTALRWVQANIEKFGGDPDSVTILGESSGGTVVMGLLVAEQADGLFHNAIAQSAPVKWVTTYEDAYEGRKSFVSDVGCTQETETERRECLKSMDVESLSKHVDINRGWGFYDFPLGAGPSGESMDYNVIEPTVVKVAPADLGNVQQRRTPVNVYISNTAQETGYNALYYSTNQVETWEEAEELLKKKLEDLENATEFEVPEGLLKKIEKTYNFKSEDNSWWPQIFYDTICTDVRVTCQSNELVTSLNSNPHITAYRFYIESRPDEKLSVRDDFQLPYDSIHGWDSEALFGYGWFKLASSGERHQRKLQDNLRDMVARIARGQEIEGWQEGKSLIFSDDDFPRAVRPERREPQERECRMWRENDMLQWGWQN